MAAQGELLEFTSGANKTVTQPLWRIALLFPRGVKPTECARMKAQVILASPQADVPECFAKFDDIKKFRGAPFHYLFTLESRTRITAESLDTALFKFDRVGWNFFSKDFKDSKNSLQTGLQKCLKRFFLMLERERPSQEWALIIGLTESKRLTLTPDGEYFDKIEDKSVSFEEAARLFVEESPRQKHYWRAVAELTVVLGLGEAWYWSNADFNKPDWKLGWNWQSWRKKLITGEAIRLDSNTITVNINAHPWTGALYYSLARQNGLRSYEAYLMGFAMSGIWEFLVEYREYVSINDLIMTPVGGQALGEVFTQLGWFFDQGGDTRANQVLSSIFSGPQKFHDWLDQNTKGFHKRHSKKLDRYGFTKEIFHRFQLSASLGVQSFSGSAQSFLTETRLETHLVHIPGYATKTGSSSKVLYDTAMTDLVLRLGKSSNRFQEVMLYVRAALAGYYRQSIAPGTSGKSGESFNGYRFFIGPSVGYTLEARDFPSEKEMSLSEGMGIAHVLGSSLDLVILQDDLKIHLTLDVFADFAAIRSLAVEQYVARHHFAWPSSTLMSGSRYDFEFGVSLKTLAVIEYRKAEIGIEAEKGMYSGIHGHDDYQDYIDQVIGRESKITEEMERLRGWIGYLLPGDQWKLLITLEARRRKSVLDETEVQQTDVRTLGNVMFQF